MSPTPILDLEKDPPKRGISKVGIAVGAVLGLALGFWLINADLPNTAPLWWIPGFYLAVAIHELGHLVAARFAGISSGGISVGGVYFVKSGAHWVFRFDRRSIIGGFFRPLPEVGEFRRERFAWMVAGGPLASLALTVAFTLARLRFGEGAWDWIGSMLGVAWMVFLVSLIPASAGAQKSDRTLLWLLLRNPRRSQCWVALVALQAEDARGVMPRDWGPELVDQISKTDVRWGEYPNCQMVAFYRKAAERDEQGALLHLENALSRSSRIGKAAQHLYFLEAASASAITRRNATQARCWLQRACKLLKPQSTAGIEAGIAMAEGRFDDAIRHLGAARELIVQRKLDSGLARWAKERIGELEAECRAAMEHSRRPV